MVQVRCQELGVLADYLKRHNLKPQLEGDAPETVLSKSRSSEREGWDLKRDPQPELDRAFFGAATRLPVRPSGSFKRDGLGKPEQGNGKHLIFQRHSFLPRDELPVIAVRVR